MNGFSSSPNPTKEIGEEPIVQILRQEILELTIQLSRKQRVEQALLATKRRLQRLISSSPSVIFSAQSESDFGIIFVSQSIEQFGYKSQDFLENLGLWKRCIHPEDLSYVFSELRTLGEKSNLILEYRFLNSDGEYRWIQDQRRHVYDSNGKPIETVGSWQDITDRKLMEDALYQEKETAQNVLQSIGDGVITTSPKGNVQYINPSAEKLTGWPLQDAKDKPLVEVFRITETEKLESTNNIIRTVNQSEKVVSLPHSSNLITGENSLCPIEGSIAPIQNYNREIVGNVLVFRDVTQNEALARELSWQATHDYLTGLVNRREFEVRLASTISLAKEDNHQHTLGYLDLDQFKIINDTFGHGAGDELLRKLSTLLSGQLQNADTVARIGGDEFGIILNQTALDDSVHIFENLLNSIRNFRFPWKEEELSVGCSIGLVAIDDSSQNVNELLGAADAACYAAKESGRNRIQVYQADDNQLQAQRGQRQWATIINRALEENRFILYKQAITPTHNAPHQAPHYELLIRMVNEQGELVSPASFIPAAERYGLMPQLDHWVIKNFFEAYQNHEYLRKDEHIYAINLSGLSITDESFLVYLKEQFTLFNISPTNVCFEITETAAISNLANAVRLIEEMKALGCLFALDDFGSGMSSFAYIKHLPVDYLKIDGIFIKNIIKDPFDSSLVACMNQIGHEFGMKTIAEFVEDEKILNRLEDLGIDFVQGYCIDEPSPLILDNFE